MVQSSGQFRTVDEIPTTLGFRAPELPHLGNALYLGIAFSRLRPMPCGNYKLIRSVGEELRARKGGVFGSSYPLCEVVRSCCFCHLIPLHNVCHLIWTEYPDWRRRRGGGRMTQSVARENSALPLGYLPPARGRRRKDNCVIA